MSEGCLLGLADGCDVGRSLGLLEGCLEGLFDGREDGLSDGWQLGLSEGCDVGAVEGACCVALARLSVWDTDTDDGSGLVKLDDSLTHCRSTAHGLLVVSY